MASITEALGTDIAHRGDFLRSPGGDIQVVSGLANLKQALFHRLLTVPGTLVHRPGYGIGIQSYQNAPSSFGVQQKLANLIQTQFLQDPRVEAVLGVSISADDSSPQQVIINVSVKPVGYSDTVQMQFTPFAQGLGA